MGKATARWTDERLDEFAAALGPVAVQVAVLEASVEQRLADENRALREELVATQRQLLQIAWGLVAALIAAAAALIADLV